MNNPDLFNNETATEINLRNELTPLFGDELTQAIVDLRTVSKDNVTIYMGNTQMNRRSWLMPHPKEIPSKDSKTITVDLPLGDLIATESALPILRELFKSDFYESSGLELVISPTGGHLEDCHVALNLYQQSTNKDLPEKRVILDSIRGEKGLRIWAGLFSLSMRGHKGLGEEPPAKSEKLPPPRIASILQKYALGQTV